ncbi:MAG: hypothetical protein PUB96_04145 [Helicobacteraceae bacterium]|nr:hypothetical protein [Helicobacteraceae bacterium]
MKNISILLIIFTFFSGCFSKIPQANLYEIGFLELPQNTQKKQKSIVLNLAVSPKIASTKIAYKTSTNSIAYFAKNKWVTPLDIITYEVAQKSANALNISLLDSGEVLLKIDILDFYFDSTKEAVVLNALVNFKDSSFLNRQEISVREGDFSEIIKAFEIALNKSFLEIFSKVK